MDNNEYSIFVFSQIIQAPVRSLLARYNELLTLFRKNDALCLINKNPMLLTDQWALIKFVGVIVGVIEAVEVGVGVGVGVGVSLGYYYIYFIIFLTKKAIILKNPIDHFRITCTLSQ